MTYNGSTWSTPSEVDPDRSCQALSCTSSSFCVAVDNSGCATIYNGTSWSTPSDVDSDRLIYQVACTSSSFCVAIDSLDNLEHLFETRVMPDEPIPIFTVDSELEAKARLGKVVLRGGAPYEVTGYRPMAELRWQLVGFALPPHP